MRIKNNGQFSLVGQDGAARAGELMTSHGVVQTPTFMPVGTRASVKALDPHVVSALGAQIILGNTYHLYLAPGHKRIQALGGLHQFMQWDKPILTDSGGFQVFSLGLGLKHRGDESETDSRPQAKITGAGVTFRSHRDGSEHHFTPEIAMDIQASLGADIIMAFDECPPYGASTDYYKESLKRTHRWLVRSINHKTKIEEQPFAVSTKKGNISQNEPRDQLLFGIIQGGMDKALRLEAAQFVSAQQLPGIAVGGLALGEPHEEMIEQIRWVVPHLSTNKPRYAMGIGTPLDLIECVEQGIDMFDCVLPTRLGRNGAAWIVEEGRGERAQLKNARFADDSGALEAGCVCSTCSRFSRAYIHHLCMENEPLAMQLLSIHNLHVLLDEMHLARQHILSGTFALYTKSIRKQWA